MQHMSDSDDLYAGLTLPTRTKREAPGRDGATDGSNTSTNNRDDCSATDLEQEERAAKRPRAAALDVPAAIAKLKGYMLVDKKFPKASKLFAQLIAERMDAQSLPLFVEALQDVTAAKSTRWSGTRELEALVQQFVTTFDALPVVAATDSNYTRSIAKRVDDWKLIAITHRQLFTDETYEFVKAAQVVKARLEQVPAAVSLATHSDEEATGPIGGSNSDDTVSPAIDSSSSESVAYELELLMPLLRTLFRKHATAWAKATVETVLALATQRRLRFSNSHRSEIDTWTTAIQSRRAAPAVARTAASDARRNIVAAADSEATLRVGKSNHPLFNRQ